MNVGYPVVMAGFAGVVLALIPALRGGAHPDGGKVDLGPAAYVLWDDGTVGAVPACALTVVKD